MVAIGKKTPQQQSWPWWRWTLVGLSVLALVLSSILSWHFLKGGSLAGCSGGSPCDSVLNSRWSTIAGVLPVSSLAMGAYLAILVASFFIGPDTEPSIRRLAWKALLVLAGAIAGSALWFTYLQKWIIGEFCLYCMTTHITGLLLAVLVIWRAIKEFKDHSNDNSRTTSGKAKKVSQNSPQPNVSIFNAVSPILIGLILVGIVVAGQVSITPKAVYSGGESQNNLPAIDYHDVPMIGSPNAPYIISVLFDYECPHCQKLHLMLNETVRRFNGKVAFALFPTPLNPQCNPYITQETEEFKNSCELAKISLAVWIAKREAFSAFENWMYTFESGDRWRPRGPEAARAKAVELVGEENFKAAYNDPRIEAYLQTGIRIYGQTLQNGNGGVPKMVFGSHWVIPQPNNVNDLVMIIQNSLGVPKP